MDDVNMGQAISTEVIRCIFKWKNACLLRIPQESLDFMVFFTEIIMALAIVSLFIWASTLYKKKKTEESK